MLDTKVSEVETNCKTGKFARVCAKCHGKAHALIDKGIKDWELIKFYIKEFLETNPSTENDAHLRAWHKFMRDKIRVRQLPLPIKVESEKQENEGQRGQEILAEMKRLKERCLRWWKPSKNICETCKQHFFCF
ncbi:MAG: hypothetical protein V1767_04295 [Chloroflexota bacterium]